MAVSGYKEKVNQSNLKKEEKLPIEEKHLRRVEHVLMHDVCWFEFIYRVVVFEMDLLAKYSFM